MRGDKKLAGKMSSQLVLSLNERFRQENQTLRSSCLKAVGEKKSKRMPYNLADNPGSW